jgi:hypothetical protein
LNHFPYFFAFKFNFTFKELLEGIEHVEWQGQKFQPKPAKLSRVNSAEIRSRNSFGSNDMKVTYSKATPSAGINVASKDSLQTIYIRAEMQKKQVIQDKNCDKRRQ